MPHQPARVEAIRALKTPHVHEMLVVAGEHGLVVGGVDEGVCGDGVQFDGLHVEAVHQVPENDGLVQRGSCDEFQVGYLADFCDALGVLIWELL